MITVHIGLNGYPLVARSAVNLGTERCGKTKYKVDDGSFLWHRREDGAIPLAIALLKTIKSVDALPRAAAR